MALYTQIPQCEIAFSCAAFNRRYYGEQFLQSFYRHIPYMQFDVMATKDALIMLHVARTL